MKPGIDLDTIKVACANKSLVYKRLDSLAKLKKYHVKISLQSLQQISRADEDSRIGPKIPAYFAQIAMILGMIGTFIGLAELVAAIAEDMPEGPQSLAQLTASFQNVKVVLGGMKTAFATTLVGLLVVILTSMFGFHIDSLRIRVFRQLEHWTVEELIPASAMVLEDQSLLERVSLQMEESFSRLESVFSQNAAALEELGGMQQAFSTIVDQIHGLTSKGSLQRIDKSLAQAARAQISVMNIAESVGTLVKTNSKIHQGVKSFVAQMKTILEQSSTSFGQGLADLTHTLKRWPYSENRALFRFFFYCTVVFLVFYLLWPTE